MPLEKLLIKAEYIGLYFAATLFVKKWTFEECKTHIKGFKIKKDRVYLNNVFLLDLNTILNSNNPKILLPANNKEVDSKQKGSEFMPILAVYAFLILTEFKTEPKFADQGI